MLTSTICHIPIKLDNNIKEMLPDEMNYLKYCKNDTK